VTDPPIDKAHHRDDGVSLGSLWKGSPEAYNGTVVSGFPNLFFLLGPNLGTGHSSAMTIIEAQLDLLVRTMIEMRREKWSSLDVRSETQAKYNAEVQAALQTTVYNAGGCSSYYLDKKWAKPARRALVDARAARSRARIRSSPFSDFTPADDEREEDERRGSDGGVVNVLGKKYPAVLSPASSSSSRAPRAASV